MPVTPRATRRTSNSRQDGAQLKGSPTKPRPQGLYEPTSVQDRIRQWQAQGAGDALSPDALSVRSIPLSGPVIETPRARTPEKKAPNSAPSWRQRFLEKERQLREEERATRNVTAPKKRLVSDEHWKSKRDDRTKISPQPSSKSNIHNPHYDLSYTSTQAPEHREARRAERRRSRRARNSDGNESLAQNSATVQDLSSYIEQELARHLENSSHCDNLSDRASVHSSLFPEDDQAPVSRSRYAESLGRAALYTGGTESKIGKPKGARILSKTKEIFNKIDEPPPVANRIPNIEAWLDGQPDPFVETASASADRLPAVEVPEPLRRRSRRTKKRTSGRPVVDANKIWDSVTVYEDDQDPRKPHPSPSFNVGPENDSKGNTRPNLPRDGTSPEASPTSLKRRGARGQRKPQPPDHCPPTSQSPQTADLPLRVTRQHEGRPQRGCPSTGAHRLETIASLETFKENQEPPPYEELPSGKPCGLKRKLTTHEDLMSVLSLPMHRKSNRSRRRARNTSSKSAAEVLKDLVAEEEKYNRELRTLVDGVIPVLLQCVLSKSDSVATAGLFASAANGSDDMTFTKPIIDMGIALERLKTLHGRIPLDRIDSLLVWAQNAKKTYNDYLIAWRLGFQDIIINLAPLDEGQDTVDRGMSRDADGDVVNAEGEKVDVAYLLKRPLVRIKNLSKTFASIQEQTGKPLAADVAQIFDELTNAARRRHQEQQARLEDDAAANIDTTRSRNIRTLGPNANVILDKTRKVRARDCFNLTMYHSTGQRMDCRIEMIFRDNQASQPVGGDVLISEIDESGKWLLFSPINLSAISARRGEDGFDLVIMIRGPSGIGQEWHELLALKSDDPEATTEWMSMLGSYPLPPKLNRTRSFKEKGGDAESQRLSSPTKVDQKSIASGSTGEVDVPLGEPSVVGGHGKWSPRSKPVLERFIPRLNLGGGLQSKHTHVRAQQDRSVPKTFGASTYSSDRSTISNLSLKELPKTPKASSAPATPSHGVQSRISPQKEGSSKCAEQYMMSGALLPPDHVDETVKLPHQLELKPEVVRKSSPSSVPRPGRHLREDASPSASSSESVQSAHRPRFNRAVSSTPSQDLPTITKLRGPSTQEKGHDSIPLNESMGDQWNALSGGGNSGLRRRRRTRTVKSEIFTEDIPSPPAHTTNRELPPESALLRPTHTANPTAPPPPPHRDFSGITSSPSTAAPPELQLRSPTKPESGKKRRSSSPLKREYAPSTASETSSESDSDSMSDSSSETSQDFMSEVQDMHTPLVAVTAGNRRSSKIVQRRVSVPTTGTRTLAPSDSASQGPYRKVPASSTVRSDSKSKTIALVCAWSDKGSWEQIHPDECSIVISPGLIEAFEMSAAHSGTFGLGRDRASDAQDWRTSSLTEQPLVAFELTPIVPLRRGTALDINIRSPPTANSKLKTTSNIMFRSRNADECDSLYGMINWARCNNPTYIQLQIARPRQPTVTFNVGPQPTRSKSGSWFSFGGSDRKSSYRASSAPGAMSIGGESTGSIGTMSTAISALKRFGVSSAFNLNRSSVSRKSGFSRTSGSLYSSSTGTRTGSGSGSGSSTPIPSQLGFVPGKDGPNVPSTSAEAAGGGGMVNNMKIRLYIRKSQQWENLGAGRLSVLPAPGVAPTPGEGTPAGGSEPSTGQNTPTRQPSTRVVGQPGSRGPRLPSSSHTPHRIHGNGREKRIVVRKNKDGDIVLLDAVLGESCFERVMQTGIAVKVWNEDEVIGDTGGVVMGRERIYMMQFPGTREAGWVFGLCGSYRYGVD